MSNLQILGAVGALVLVSLFLYVWRPWRQWTRREWTILNGYGPGQFKTPYPMTVKGAARFAAAVGWSVTHVDYGRHVLLVKKRA